jgi:hypothetical protein
LIYCTTPPVDLYQSKQIFKYLTISLAFGLDQVVNIFGPPLAKSHSGKLIEIDCQLPLTWLNLIPFQGYLQEYTSRVTATLLLEVKDSSLQCQHVSFDDRELISVNNLCPGSITDYSLIMQTKKTVKIGEFGEKPALDWEITFKKLIDGLVGLFVLTPNTHKIFVPPEANVRLLYLLIARFRLLKLDILKICSSGESTKIWS